MTSKIVVNNIEADTGVSTVTFGSPVSAPTFIGNVSAASGITTVTRLNVGTGGTVITTTSNGLLGVGTASPVKTLDVRGEATFGVGITTGDLNWVKDTYQQVYSFSGITGGSSSVPADGVILLANPNANPSNTRIGAIVFGNKVSGTTATANSGIKAVIDSYTNSNVTNAADTGGYIRVQTKPNNGDLLERMRIDSSGRMTLPYQPASCVYNLTGTINTGSESTWVVAKFQNSTVNRGSAYDSSTGLFTCPVAGVYFVSCFFLCRSNAAHNITVYKNGSGIGPTGRDITSSGEQNTGVQAYVDCAANDTLGIYVSNGSSGDYYSAYNYCLFSLFG